MSKVLLTREATIEDITQLQIIRNSVIENTLSNPDLIQEKDYKEFMTARGKDWVCEIANEIIGFAIIDLQANNVWALFVKLTFEKLGIGKQLHKTMLD